MGWAATLALMLSFLLAACASNRGEFSSKPPSLHVGEVALRSQEPGIAASIAENRLAQDPGDLDALLLRSQAQAAQGQTVPATIGFRQILTERPNSPDAALGLARILMPTNPAAADAVLAPFAIRGDATAAIWNNLGVARDLLGRHVDAQAAYRSALAADPTMQSAQVNLARSLSLTRTQ